MERKAVILLVILLALLNLSGPLLVVGQGEMHNCPAAALMNTSEKDNFSDHVLILKVLSQGVIDSEIIFAAMFVFIFAAIVYCLKNVFFARFFSQPSYLKIRASDSRLFLKKIFSWLVFHNKNCLLPPLLRALIFS